MISFLSMMPKAQRVFLAGILALALGLVACAAPSPRPKPPPSRERVRLIERSAELVREFRAKPEFKPLNTLLERAVGVFVFPGVVKAGLGIGVESGKGLAVGYGPEGQVSAPAFYKLVSPSIGLTAGFSETNYVFVVMNRQGFERMLGNSVDLASGVRVSAGPKGDVDRLSLAHYLDDVYVYATTGGFSLDFSVEGTGFTAELGANNAFYGQDTTPRGILLSRDVDSPLADPLKQALKR